MNKTLLSIFVALGLCYSTAVMPVMAETTDTDDPTLSALMEQVQALLAQVTLLQEQLTISQGEQVDLREEIRDVKSEFVSYLREGVTSDEVRRLQEMLAGESDVYPEGIVSGYYGPLTAKAVTKFQKKYGIDQVGVVGPQTRSKLNSLYYKNGNAANGNAPWKRPVADVEEDDDIDEDEDDDDVDDDDDFSMMIRDGKVALCKLSGTHNQHMIRVSINSLGAHTRKGATIGLCAGMVIDNVDDDDDDVDDDVDDDADDDDVDDDDVDDDADDDDDDDNDDVTGPYITIDDDNEVVTSSTAVITWETDEESDSLVSYGLTVPLSMEVSDPEYVLDHEILLEDLLPLRNYFYTVTSVDESGNPRTSEQGMFLTSEAIDEEAPEITAVEALDITHESARLVWTLDESADSTVEYYVLSIPGTVTSVDVDSDTELSLTGLDAEVEYSYLITAEDALGNATTSEEYTFTTLEVPVVADETAPVISLLEATNIASTTVTISWETDEDATHTVWYGTTASAGADSPNVSVTIDILGRLPSFDLEGLATSTMYYYLAVSEDAEGNDVTSGELDFTTSAD